jgi:hypothetical protein
MQSLQHENNVCFLQFVAVVKNVRTSSRNLFFRHLFINFMAFSLFFMIHYILLLLHNVYLYVYTFTYTHIRTTARNEVVIN